MIRRRRLITQALLLALLGVLAFPSAGSALRPTFTISLTSSGPSPASFETPAGLGSISFENTDSVAHTISFSDGWCSGQVEAGARLNCGFRRYVGDYAYSVDGSTQADVVVEAVGRSVSLAARSHSVRRGSWL